MKATPADPAVAAGLSGRHHAAGSACAATACRMREESGPIASPPLMLYRVTPASSSDTQALQQLLVDYLHH